MYGTIIKTSPAVPDHRGVLVRFALRVEYGEVPYMVQQEFSHGRNCNPEKGWHDMTGSYSATLVLRHMIEAPAGQPCEHCEEPVAYCNRHQRWEHINGETCFLDGPACEAIG